MKLDQVRSKPLPGRRPLSFVLLVVLFFFFGFIAAVLANFESIPSSDTAQQHFDTLIVLGTPSLPDGTPSPEQRERVSEGVREYKSGVAEHIIMTGGAAHNHFIEAHSMALLAEAQGVPRTAILEEGRAQDTIQNIYYSRRIMQDHGWRSAEVVSSPSHLPRTSLILGRYKDLAWRTHSALWPREYKESKILSIYTNEALGCLRLRLRGFPHSAFIP